MEKIINHIARFISIVFHPFAIPTMGLLIIYFSLPGIEMYPSKLTQILIGIVLVSTFVLPGAFVLLMAATKNIQLNMMHHRDRMLPFIFSAFSIYMGAQLIGKLPLPGVFRLFMLGSCLLLIVMFMITLKWKISGHAAAIGGLTALLISVTLKYGIDLKWAIISAILVSGLIASSRLILNKHQPAQLYAGYILGFVVIFFTGYYF